MEIEERWMKYYSSYHRILIVGDGDFSFSTCLALHFGTAFNMLATSLDSYDILVAKYKNAKWNLEMLVKLGAHTLHGVDATKMRLHSDLMMQKFDRIIFNFPHAGFHGKEDDIRLIERHKKLLLGFFQNASGMLRANGEIHVTHKTSTPFSLWNLEGLAWVSSLRLIECVDFKIEDYPGYNNKRGDSSRCDEPFPLGECSTFKFVLFPELSMHVDNNHLRSEDQRTWFHHGNPRTYFSENLNNVIPEKLLSVVGNVDHFVRDLNHFRNIYQSPMESDPYEFERSLVEAIGRRHQHLRNLVQTYGCT
ncbi:hypothetical protein M5689_013976 [Euphorbia peplus]|nr:hypothetical protein M5689_013976 [Euphorbia peplus]